MMEVVLETDLFRCVAYRSLDEHGEAKAALRRALSFAEPEGYIRLFVNHSTEILPILNDLVEENYGSTSFSHFWEVLSACRMDGNRRIPARRDWPKGGSELTDRETDVLKLVVAGYTYKEIGSELCISLDTTKTHVKHILRKLDVSSRSQAIRRARALQLV